ncbi:hypothetical protein ACEV8P_07545 [Vibrio parahaemolyticus]
MKYKIVSFFISLSLIGCSTSPISTVEKTLEKDYAHMDIQSALQDFKANGYFCSRYKKAESDERLKVITDGTLNEVQFYICDIEDSDAMCVSRAGTNLVSQYGVVIRANGIHESKTCLWD